MLYYSLLGLMVLVLVILVYSYLYYRNFIFHIDYKAEEFVLQKGVFSTENVALPFDKIQQVYLKRSLLQRIIGVYSVVVDTAGSKEDEVQIDAVSEADANQLSAILIKAKKEGVSVTEEASYEVQQESDELWIHELDIPTLLKIGISTNYARGLAIVFAFFTTIYNELNSLFRDRTEELDSYYQEIQIPESSVTLFLIILVILLLVSIVITVLEVFIKYFGLKLTQTPRSLELEMGLKTNTKVSLQPRRVQLMQVVTNPVQKRFNLYEARIALASSENALQKKKTKIPGLNELTVEKVKQFLFGSGSSSFESIFRPHRFMLLRRFMRIFIPVLISIIIPVLWEEVSFLIWLIFAVVISGIGTLYQFYLHRSLRLIFTDEFLLKKSGVWNKTVSIFEIYKIQGISVKQPIWYRRRNIVNLYFHSAGGDISFRGVDKDVVPFINYILYKAEISKKNWM